MKARAGVEDLDEDAGPLEATILHLKKEIASVQAAGGVLQRAWIKDQTELVAVQNRNALLGEDLHDKRAHLSILEQTRVRIDAAHAAEKKEGVRLARLSDSMHTEMGKINRLVSEHGERQQALAVIRAARHDPKLNFIALALHGKQMGFAKVIAMVDDMVASLKKEQEDDDK